MTPTAESPGKNPTGSIRQKKDLNQGQSIGKQRQGTVKTAGKGTVKTVSKGTVKTAQAGVKTTKAGIKTAETTAKATAKTAKTAGHVAQKAAQAAAKAAQAIAKAAATAAKVAAKAIATAVKAIVTAIKGIIAAIAAGGWIAVIIIVAICVIALIVCACCGVFASNETEDGSRPMTEAIQTIDGEFRSSIDSKIADLSVGSYDAVEVKYVGDMDGDSDFAINWNDAIAIYAVSVTMDPEAPTDVVQVTPEKVEILRRIFNEMNTVSYSTDVVETDRTIITENGDEETETIRKLIISVDVSSMDAYEAIVEAINTILENKEEILEAVTEAIHIAFNNGKDNTIAASLHQRQNDLKILINDIAEKVMDGATGFEEQLAELMSELEQLEEVIRQRDREQKVAEHENTRLNEIMRIIQESPNTLTEYDDALVRQIVDKVVVDNKEQITVCFGYGVEILVRIVLGSGEINHFWPGENRQSRPDENRQSRVASPQTILFTRPAVGQPVSQ